MQAATPKLVIDVRTALHEHGCHILGDSVVQVCGETVVS